MTEQEQIQLAEREAARLAALAAEPAIAAGAADEEVGPAVLAGHLPNEVAVAHRMMMQLAAISAAVLDWPLGQPGMAAPASAFAALDTTPAALAAARLAGAACRQMEQVRQSLPALSVPLAADGHWQALAWAGEVCSGAELARRFEAARAAARDIRPAHGASAGARAIEAAARASAALLAAEAGAEHLACAIAATSGRFPRRLFAHELAAGHGLYMRLGGRFDAALARAAALRREPVAALRLANASARISARLRRGRATLALVEAASQGGPAGGPGNGGGKPRPSHNSFWGGADGGYVPPGPESVPTAPAATAGHGVPPADSISVGAAPRGRPVAEYPGGHMGPPLQDPYRRSPAFASLLRRSSRFGCEGRKPASAVEVRAAFIGGRNPSATDWNKSLPDSRRGQLNNGNRSGDFLAAPRCGARTRRATCCLQPAMKNGRCRLHGGKSTGPRTAQGRARAATARLRHGAYRAEVIALQRAAAHQLRRMKPLIAAIAGGHAGPPLPNHGHVGASPCARPTQPSAGHGVDPTIFPRAAAVGATNPAAPGVDTPLSRFYCAGAKERVSECPPRVSLARTPPSLKYNFAAMG